MQASASVDGRTLEGVRVFVVEDESLVAMQLEDMLLDFGCEIAGLAMRVARAREMIGANLEADIAVLDVNIAGETVYPIAELLRSLQIPIVFATGYGRTGVVEDWQSCPILQKPYTEREMAAALRTALSNPLG